MGGHPRLFGFGRERHTHACLWQFAFLPQSKTRREVLCLEFCTELASQVVVWTLLRSDDRFRFWVNAFRRPLQHYCHNITSTSEWLFMHINSPVGHSGSQQISRSTGRAGGLSPGQLGCRFQLSGAVRWSGSGSGGWWWGECGWAATLLDKINLKNPDRPRWSSST